MNKKKFFSKIKITLLLPLMLLSSCSRLKYMFKSDKEVASDEIQEVITSIENKDKEKLSSLFSVNTVKAVPELDSQMDSLFDYYKGNKTEFTIVNGSSEKNDDEGYYKILMISSDITTTSDKFRLTFDYYLTDTIDSNNEGIKFMYIIRFDDDPNSHYVETNGKVTCYTYWGDGNDTLGINIGKVYEKY